MKLLYILAASTFLASQPTSAKPGIGNPVIIEKRHENWLAKNDLMAKKLRAALDRDDVHHDEIRDKNENREAMLEAKKANFLWKRNVIRDRRGMLPCPSWDAAVGKTCPGDENA